jgi:MurNAc alpha-1-phosphate uridylyltransferase
MVLAAGRGERMRPLTDTCPKPLLRVGGEPLIDRHLHALARAGVRDVVVNHAHLGALVAAHVGDGLRYRLRAHLSPEPEALETAGGIAQALPLLGDAPFVVVNGDVWADLDFAPLLARAATLAPDVLAHLLLVDNPPQHPDGDFALRADGFADAHARPRLTFSGVGLYRPALFAAITPGRRAKLAPLLTTAMDAEQVTAEHFRGPWVDVGTPERLAALDAQVRAASAPPAPASPPSPRP